MPCGWVKASACCFHVCLIVPILHYPLPVPGSHLVCLFIVSPVFLKIVSPHTVSRWWYAMSIGYLIFCWRVLPMPTSVFRLVQSSLWPLSFLLSRCLFSSPGMWCLTSFFPFLFVQLLACYKLVITWLNAQNHPGRNVSTMIVRRLPHIGCTGLQFLMLCLSIFTPEKYGS